MSNVDEINLLMERTHETYSVACELHQNHHYNDAISRAYYSMFYAAKAVLLTKDVVTRTHRGTISQLNINFVREGELEETIWKYLPMTETLREEADYSITKRITKEESEEILKGANIFIKRCNTLLSQKTGKIF
ncbi:HEPN domain-containing protein [Methanospirillum sp.]